MTEEEVRRDRGGKMVDWEHEALRQDRARGYLIRKIEAIRDIVLSCPADLDDYPCDMARRIVKVLDEGP